jgi:predicted enzyme related to lactoylglutathione lyase
MAATAPPRTYPHGVPSWVDTEQPDPDAAVHFYGGLFGWTFENVMPPGAPGSYLIARLDGKDVAAVGPAGAGIGTPAWNTYIAVDDADATAAAVTAAGGTVLAAPQDAGPGGRTATCADPDGAGFRLWQARRRPGAQLVNVPGAWNFSDLHATDPAAALGFYAPLFGWVADQFVGARTMVRVPGYGDHLAATVDPDIRRRQAHAPTGFADVIGGFAPTAPGEAPHWHVTFSHADRDAGAVAAERLGGTVVSTGETMWARQAVLRDPAGALFTISQFAPPPRFGPQ